MDRLPTLLVLANASATTPKVAATSPLSHEDQAIQLFDTLHSTLQTGLESGLPLLLVAPKDIAERARRLLPGNSVVELPPHVSGESGDESDGFAQAVVVGVLASSQANGWLILPASIPMLRAETLRRIAAEDQHQPVVFPQYQQLRGHPVRFSSEFFSELIRIQSSRDLNRLIARYPARGVEVDDPGVLMVEEKLIGLDRHHNNGTKNYSAQYE